MNHKPKLELTWIGKDQQPKLEPRILIEDPEKSYGDKNTENMLIYGDNLLALKALEQDFTGKINCIYIDPPFNTGSAFEHYDDSLEHSLWLTLMRDRLKLLYNLLSEQGAIFVHIDYNEEAYLRVLMDEIFGRNNFRNAIIVSRIKKNIREREKVKAINFAHDVVLFYAKSENTLISPPVKKASREERWHAFDAPGIRKTMEYDLFGFKPPKNRHWLYEEEKARKMIVDGDLKPNPKTGKPHYRIPAVTEEICDTMWSDIMASSFNWNFPNGEKNEKLIQRIFEMGSEENDWVLDSFLGSGTTAAVAQKMNRKWIGIELGDHCHTHCIPRLQKVCDGSDQGGISEAVEWKGGGGFKYYYLAPSLLKQDKYNNWVINPEYNGNMLASAMAKHEGFRYQPDEQIYWKQGQSTEKDFIYTTTQFITVETLDRIHEEMRNGESLLICCKSFSKACEDRYSNITIKKIPKMLLGRCEFGKEDYSLNIISMPVDPDSPEFIPKGVVPKPLAVKKKNGKTEPSLFNSENGGEE